MITPTLKLPEKLEHSNCVFCQTNLHEDHGTIFAESIVSFFLFFQMRCGPVVDSMHSKPCHTWEKLIPLATKAYATHLSNTFWSFLTSFWAALWTLVFQGVELPLTTLWLKWHLQHCKFHWRVLLNALLTFTRQAVMIEGKPTIMLNSSNSYIGK